jgi:transmembrane sensor
MTDIDQRIHEATALIEPGWDEARAAAVERSFLRRRRRRSVTRAVVATTTSLALIIVGATLALRHPTRQTTTTVPTLADRVVRFTDGSTATPTSDESSMRVAASLPDRAVVELTRGGARFAVAKRPERVFRVEAGPVAVEVLGTQFAVERLDQRVRVSVTEGRVRVQWSTGVRELTTGESDEFPPSAAAPAPVTSPPTRRSAGARPAASDLTWRDLAHQGEYDRAYEILHRTSPPVKDEAAELLLAADVQRLSHHPAEAVAPLQRIARDHASDPRAPLAAFTLGRVLLEELGRPVEAAQAFARAEALAPDGQLAQDAVAREVEALSRAGEMILARQRAEEYVRRYPDGRKIRSVRRFGGLE